MNNRELRIGNLVNFQFGTTIKQGYVENINAHGKVVLASFDEVSFNGYFPKISSCRNYETHVMKDCNLIPVGLTEEWLLKFGFEKSIDGFTFYGRGTDLIGMSIERDDDGWIIYSGIHFQDFMCGIEFIHELQNAFHLLHKEELVINDVPKKLDNYE